MSLLVDIANSVVGIGLLSCLALPKYTALVGEAPSVFSDVKSGLRYVRSSSFLFQLLLLYGAFILLSVPGGFLAALLVTRIYGGTYLNLTIVELVGFAGMAAGGLLLGVWGGFRSRTATLLTGITACGLLTVGLGLSQNFVLYLGIMLFLGVAITMSQTAVTTLVQERAETSMQGRVFGLTGAMYSGFLLLGMSVFGPLADKVSLPLLMILTGGALALVALLFLLNKPFRKPPLPDQAE
jgi:DHA3 family macrolide efflux protein-like MFS transporter